MMTLKWEVLDYQPIEELSISTISQFTLYHKTEAKPQPSLSFKLGYERASTSFILKIWKTGSILDVVTNHFILFC